MIIFSYQLFTDYKLPGSLFVNLRADPAPSLKVSHVRESSVLGFKIHGKKLETLDRKVRGFKQELKRITRRCPGISIESRIIRLRQYVQGWMAHYGCGLKFDDAVKFDGWIRRRLRMCYWKQWRRPRRRIRELIKLGS